MEGSNSDYTTPAAFTVSLHSTSRAECKVIYVVPVARGAGSRAWQHLGVKPLPPYTATRATIDMVTSAAALHEGFVGIPTAAVLHLALPTYTVHWVEPWSIVLGAQLSSDELELPLAETLAYKGVWIVAGGHHAFNPSSLRECLAKTLSRHVKDPLDGPRNSEQYRATILEQDNARCVITGDVECVQAAHIIDRYIGSSILGAVLSKLYTLQQRYLDRVPATIVAQLGATSLLYCDIRIVNTPPYSPPLIDNQFNGETLSASAHVSKDLYGAFGIHPPTAKVLWFNVGSAQNLGALTSCGGLAGSNAHPSGSDSRLYENREGLHQDYVERITTHFTVHCLALYLLMCQKFIPVKLKDEIKTLIPEAADGVDDEGEDAAADDEPGGRAEGEGATREGAAREGGGGGGHADMDVDDVDAPADEDSLPGSYREGGVSHSARWAFWLFVCIGAGSLTALADWVAQADEGAEAGSGLPASASNDSNTSSIATLVARRPHSSVFREVKEAAKFEALREDDRDEDKSAVKAHVLELFPHLAPHDLTAKQLETYHQDVVFKACLLLRLTAALGARHNID
ncbi:hypothetical protein C8R47DRAFT_63302 [Mycena vitilis]|nr:hypothetical protein C8R47DRAFT_63302 [Mycena vitilis]